MVGGIERYSVRTIIRSSIVAVAVIALAATGALLLLGSVVTTSSRDLSIALESVHLAEELEVDLLRYTRARDESTRGDLERRVLARAHEMRRYAGSAAERSLLGELSTSLRAFFARERTWSSAEERDAAVGRLVRDLEALVNLNLAEANATRAGAATWSRRAQILAVAVGVLLVVGAGVLLVLLPRTVVRPVGSVSAALDGYARGDRAARAEERGPTELRLMARRFNELTDELEHRRTQQYTTVAGIAHDFRNPLAALRNTAELVALGGQDEAKARRAAALIGRQVDRLDRMVSDLLESARLEATAIDLRLERCDVAAAVRDVVELLRADAPGHPIVVDAAPGGVSAIADAARVAQMVTNLVSNAIKYSPDGGTITIHVAATDDGDVAVDVVDQGIGIPQAEAERIFEPFHRVASGRGAAPGVGLGLAMVRRLAEAHGGSIALVRSTEDGSTFRLRLPGDGDVRITPTAPRQEDGSTAAGATPS